VYSDPLVTARKSLQYGSILKLVKKPSNMDPIGLSYNCV
jgi:hypothetical protein